MLSTQSIDQLKHKAAAWVAQFDAGMVLDSNRAAHALDLGRYELMIAAGVKYYVRAEEHSFEKLKAFLAEHRQEWCFGFLSYDLKNQLERLHSAHGDRIAFPSLYFFVPQHLIIIDKQGNCIAGAGYLEEIMNHKTHADQQPAVTLIQKVPREQYLEDVQSIRGHIINGDVYELNYCVEFFAEHVRVDPVLIYDRLRHRSPVPFGCFVKHGQQYLMGASPERFLMKQDRRIVSQPIKGTARRGATAEEDEQQKRDLLGSEKERAENLMIVDLVRNDLARSAETGTVQVDELFGIYTFPQVHQMISTISAIAQKEADPVDAILQAFPMGSMTGAPKIMAMKLIERYEQTKRGLYSGAIGYFSPDGDFDLNVVIRSIQYNAATGYLNFEVGGAITYDSVPEQEYEECLLKAKAMMEVLAMGEPDA